MPVADQLQVEGGRTEIPPGRAAGRGVHAPAAEGGAGPVQVGREQDRQGRALLGVHVQSLGQAKVEPGCAPPQFREYGAYGSGACRLVHHAERFDPIFDLRQRQPTRIEPEGEQSRSIEEAVFAHRRRLLHHQGRAIGADLEQPGQAEHGEQTCCGPVSRGSGDLMDAIAQPAKGKAAVDGLQPKT
jgi:hypothetical protein